MSLFSCKHPARHLAVSREATVSNIDRDFDKVTYHLFCQNCHKDVDVVFARTIGEMKARIERTK